MDKTKNSNKDGKRWGKTSDAIWLVECGLTDNGEEECKLVRCQSKFNETAKSSSIKK